MKIAISGKKEHTFNYVKYLCLAGIEPCVSLDTAEICGCDALLLPGGGDVTPAFFGEHNQGSVDIDTELDILQIQSLKLFLERKKPILGICKGMQLLNIIFGGTLIQHMRTATLHCAKEDLYHPTQILEGSCLYELYGKHAIVNSAHHQAVGKTGKELIPIQWCEADGCVEAIVHESLPVLGLQWHPERLLPSETPIDGQKILELFVRWIHAENHQIRSSIFT